MESPEQRAGSGSRAGKREDLEWKTRPRPSGGTPQKKTCRAKDVYNLGFCIILDAHSEVWIVLELFRRATPAADFRENRWSTFWGKP